MRNSWATSFAVLVEIRLGEVKCRFDELKFSMPYHNFTITATNEGLENCTS